MMPQSKKTRRTEITIETARVIVISKPTRIFGWCAECNEEVDWVAVDEVALLAGASSRGVFRMVEAGELHSTETREGILLVCTGSLVTAGRTSKCSGARD